MYARSRECAQLTQLLEAVRAGESWALVIKGEPGVGKTTLPGYAVERARQFRVVRVTGVQSEMERLRVAASVVHAAAVPSSHPFSRAARRTRRSVRPGIRTRARWVSRRPWGHRPLPKPPGTGHCCVSWTIPNEPFQCGHRSGDDLGARNGQGSRAVG
ncbi:ATP-binding protein [Streptomyces sp. NRRL WC-3725]|uniref:AAA family ATPase n=1 Tax=Streptomyces sp. NRRL WC-3725 TaxID=1463933 RepID=UPI000D142DA9